jgi:serine/threonine protein kinase
MSLARLTAALSDRYRIERELGSGGMATVYLAHDLKHGRQVAIKVLKPELAAVLGADRFVVEIKTTAALQHPHILPLFDSGSSDGFLYYVMPFIDGETLRSKLDRETQLGIEESVRITSDVASALHYAHQHGVIHRDIKPENILLHDGRPMVADFGIALAVSAAAGGRMTETGLSLGTPHYMSPEQATAEKEITGRSDVYSLGSVLYEMLTGNPPHTGASAQQIIMKIIVEPVDDVMKHRKSVPPNVAAAVAKALEKLPADRFESARAFAEALANPGFATVGVPTRAVTATRGSRWAVGGGGVLLGMLLGTLMMAQLRPTTPGHDGAGREQLTFNGLASRPAISPDGDFVAYVESKCEHVATACRMSLVIQEVGGTKPQVVLQDANFLGTPRWSHDGSTLVIAAELNDNRTGLFAIPRLTGTAQLIDNAGLYDTHPNEASVLAVQRRTADSGIARIITLPFGQATDSFPIPIAGMRSIAWSPDARLLVAAREDGLLFLTRAGVVTDSVQVSLRTEVRWAPDGRSVLTFQLGSVREDELIRVPVDRDGRAAGAVSNVLARVPTMYQGQFDIARRTGRMALGTGDAITDLWRVNLDEHPLVAKRVTRGTTWYGSPDISHDGRTLFYYRGDALGDNVYQLDLHTGVEEALTEYRGPGGDAVRLSADGSRLAYSNRAGTHVRAGVIEFPSRRVSGADARIFGSLVAPVGAHGLLAMELNSTRLIRADSLNGVWRRVPGADSVEVYHFTVAPDGRAVLAAVMLSGTPMVGILDLARGDFRALAPLSGDGSMPGLNWSADGSMLVTRWLQEDKLPSMWRLSATGELERGAELPVPCTPRTFVVSLHSKVATCSTQDFRTDIWLYDVPGIGR